MTWFSAGGLTQKGHTASVALRLLRHLQAVSTAHGDALVRDNWEVRFCDNYDGRW
jgi:hypothetical protein